MVRPIPCEGKPVSTKTNERLTRAVQGLGLPWRSPDTTPTLKRLRSVDAET